MHTKAAEYLENIPLLHTWDDGQTWNSGGFDRAILEALMAFIENRLPPRPAILETGVGNSTIAFLLSEPGFLVTVAPDPPVFQRVEEYCRERGIPTNRMQRIEEGSEWVLPRMALEMRDKEPSYDFVLIDGSHNWPMVMVDFFYANAMLKRGGYVMLDDVQLHSVKELARLLAEHQDFRIESDWGKSLVFRRLTDTRYLGEWNSIPYIVRRTDEYAATPNCYSLAL